MKADGHRSAGSWYCGVLRSGSSRLAWLLGVALMCAPQAGAGEAGPALPATSALPALTLEEALDAALKNNRDLKTLALSLQGRKLTLDAAHAAFRWRWSPDGRAEAGSEDGTFQYGLTAARRTELGTEASVSGRLRYENASGDTDPHRAVITARLEQPLLRRFGTLVNREPITSAESQVAAARREVELKRTDLVLSVVEAYEDLYRLQRQTELAGRTLERLRQFAALTRARERQGRASRSDTLRAEQKLGNAQIWVATSLETLASRRADFADLLGAASGAAWEVLPAARLDVPASAVTEAEGVALSNRLDYAQIQQDCDDAARGLRIARRSLLPDLKVISSYEQYGAGDSPGSALRSDTDIWFVGLAVDGEFPRTAERIAADRAALGVDASGIRLDAVRAGIARQVRQELGACERLKQQVTLAERNHVVARGRVKLARRQFESGKGDSFFVANAEDELRDAEQQMLDAEAGASVSAYRVLRVLGTLIEAPPDLKPKPGREGQGKAGA